MAMPDATSIHEIPELSPAARGLCGAVFTLGAHSTYHLDPGLASARTFDELAGRGVIVGIPHRLGYYRGTPMSVAIGEAFIDDISREDLRALPHCADCHPGVGDRLIPVRRGNAPRRGRPRPG